MSETVEVTAGRKISVTFERKKGLDDYGNVVARAWVEDTLADGATDADISEAGVSLLNAVKVAVYDTLGIEVFMDESGVIREKHAPAASVKDASDMVGKQFAGTVSSGTFDTGSLKVMNANEVKEDIPKDVLAKCEELGITAVWRNDGKFGVFYKEAVSRGDTPKLPDQRDPSKGGIIKP